MRDNSIIAVALALYAQTATEKCGVLLRDGKQSAAQRMAQNASDALQMSQGFRKGELMIRVTP